MSILNRTTLTSSDKLDLLLNSVSCQPFGGITLLSDEYGVSRKTVYQTRNAALNALQTLTDDTPSPELITSVDVDVAQLRRTIVALACTAPNSIRAIEEQLPLIYPGCKVSYGYIQGVIIEAQKNAAKFNAGVPLSGIKNIALDEMFSQGNPILAGIDLDSGYLCSLSIETTRSGDTWAKVLGQAESQGMSPDCVVKDGATGMTKGVKGVFPDTQQRDDAFHALYITGKAVQKAERKAYRYIEKEAHAVKVLNNTPPSNVDEYNKAIKTVAHYEGQCELAIDGYEEAAKGLRHLHGALGSICFVSGELMSPLMAIDRLKLAVVALKQADVPDGKSAARYIENRLEGLTLATRGLYEKLLKLKGRYSLIQIELACRLTENRRRFDKCSTRQQREVIQEIAYCYQQLKHHCAERDVDELLETVGQLLSKRHRASSAIEGFNATLRSYTYVRKGVNQGFLELFQAWYNLRERRWGKHKGTSAYESLTGNSVSDWLSYLGFAPSSQYH
jgi:hypothetical protein